MVPFNCYLKLTAVQSLEKMTVRDRGEEEVAVSFKRCRVAPSVASNLAGTLAPRRMLNSQVEDKTL